METLIEKLRAHHISVTPQRLAVLEALRGREDHPTAEQIYQDVLRALPMISFNTVYKTLEVLCQRGLAAKVNPLHEVARYDWETGDHAHLICRRCRQIIDLDWRPLAPNPTDTPALRGFRLESQCFILWGLCSECQELEPAQDI